MMTVVSGSSVRAFRRTAFVAIATVSALLATFVLTATTGGAADGPAVSPGIGTAIAQAANIGPSFANLSLSFTFGRAIAGHQNGVAQASSQAIDLGQIGSTLAGEGCDGGAPTLPADQQPHEARVDSRDANPTVDQDEDFLGGLPMHKHVEAKPTPFGKAVTTITPIGIPGVLDISGGVSTATSGIVDNVRVAQATTDIGSVKFAGAVGLIELGGLHWDATYSSKTPGGVVGSFTIGTAKIAGMPLPTNDPSQTLNQLNAVLGLVGIKLTPPLAHEQGGVLFVDPLGIAVVPNATRDSVAGAILGGIQSIRQQITDALIASDCGNATYITIADLVLGSVTGAGIFKIDLGGVQATSAVTPASGFTFGGQQLLTSGGIPPSASVEGANFSQALTPVSPVLAPVQSRAPGLARPVAAERPSGTRGGWMAAVGLGGLALLALIAEGDRRKMRAAQREIPVT